MMLVHLINVCKVTWSLKNIIHVYTEIEERRLLLQLYKEQKLANRRDSLAGQQALPLHPGTSYYSSRRDSLSAGGSFSFGGSQSSRRDSMAGTSMPPPPPLSTAAAAPNATATRRDSMAGTSMPPPPPRRLTATAALPASQIRYDGDCPTSRTSNSAMSGEQEVKTQAVSIGPPRLQLGVGVPSLNLSGIQQTSSVLKPPKPLAGSAGVWPAPPPLLSERTLRAAAKAPLPDSQDTLVVFGTPRTPPKLRGAVNQTPSGSPMMAPEISPSSTQMQGHHGSAVHRPPASATDIRSEIRAIRIQELQLSYVTAKMKQSMIARAAKSQRDLACCALSLVSLQESVRIAEALHQRQALQQEVVSACHHLEPLLQQWSDTKDVHSQALLDVSNAIQSAMTNVPLVNGAVASGRSAAFNCGPLQNSQHDATIMTSLDLELQRASSVIEALSACAEVIMENNKVMTSVVVPVRKATVLQQDGHRIIDDGNDITSQQGKHHDDDYGRSAKSKVMWAATSANNQDQMYASNTSDDAVFDAAGDARMQTAYLSVELVNAVKEEVYIMGQALASLQKLKDNSEHVGSLEAHLLCHYQSQLEQQE
ncbi:hypothetical protein CEUSTIGMA_g9000.t1 [Chlamydomonas eustigma]|uniref:Uncharacterized protein n=1 Tax=Chlamydomonas eustigma TaxID=1157962 RepID=A0A250XF90_9CHLO|nr:hypothetical protein CEUSTIGMA_g9000.t1 [Chlamydomonas eustigma]|eukprot:GAX81572.1 hypothetical protein CEUSTIGMA_g9000.t1 [Chlamydomonas eustigma]